MDTDSGKTEEDLDATVAEGLGSWLREARKDRALTAAAVAQALHLDVGIVDALESESFDALGATVFAKGHVRAVANYLGLDSDEAARRFHSASGTAENVQPDLIVQYHSKPPSDRRWALGLLIALLLMLIAGLVWVVWNLTQAKVQAQADDAPAPPPVVESTPTALSSDPATTSDDFAARLDQARATESSAEQPPASVAPMSEAPATPVPAQTSAAAETATSTAGVVFSFNESCWYEVRDANGNRIAYGTARSGLTRTITGARPLSVVIGVADAVTVSVDGSDFAITPAMRRGRTARFSIP
ncbi:MAG: RodZ domain-containing protein [Pseudomonadota bacterium]